MTQRITITLPDDLHSRLQGVKEALNISQVCQEALDLAISIEEIRRKDMPVMQKTIERLKLEKQKADQEWRETGVIDGREDATELSYDEFRALESDQLSDELREWIQDRKIQYLENPDIEVYLEGWKNGALSFWEQVKAEVEEAA